MKVELLPADWSDEQVAEVNAFENALLAELDPELPPRPVKVTRVHRDLRHEPMRLAVARAEDGRVIATAWIEANVESNAHLLPVTLSVIEDQRRRGVATAMLRLIADMARAEERKQIVLGADRMGSAALSFADSLGATLGMTAHINRLVIADVDREQMQQWVDASHPDYAIEWVPSDHEYPEEWLADMAHLRGVLVNDAPMEGIPVEPRTVSYDEIRADEERMMGYGRDRLTVIARHRPSGEAVGYSEVFVHHNDDRNLFQGATAVDANHRGYALGRQLKAAMFQRIEREMPHFKFIRTFNADSNAPMLAVNNDMGFTPYSEARRWVITTEDALAWLEKRT